MPKQTFLNLPQDKKEKIITAARKEFSRVSLYEASISNIIKEADIPRGSFYQYFENKEDIFFLVLEEDRKINEDKFKDFLKNTEGDLIESFIQLYEYLIHSFKFKENKNFFRNAFLNMSHRMEQTLAPELKKENKNGRFNEFIELINISKLNINVTDDVRTIFRILMALTMSNIVESFAKRLSFDESMQAYKKQMDLVKKGIYKYNA
ncbi:TetR family transcriptional regulator [Brassicibacter mesophilus]|uniref:TetR family transcriptional regulator n=1 Tax=Brassicibacter mesophilus TaxID=745119 RepID=UPI003D217574